MVVTWLELQVFLCLNRVLLRQWSRLWILGWKKLSVSSHFYSLICLFSFTFHKVLYKCLLRLLYIGKEEEQSLKSTLRGSFAFDVLATLVSWPQHMRVIDQSSPLSSNLPINSIWSVYYLTTELTVVQVEHKSWNLLSL